MSKIPSKKTSSDLDLYSDLVNTGVDVINGIAPFSKTLSTITPPEIGNFILNMINKKTKF